MRAYVDRIMARKIELQLRYVRERSLVVDLQILLRTLWTVATTRVRQESSR